MEKYEKPSMEILEIESDIITASCTKYDPDELPVLSGE